MLLYHHCKTGLIPENEWKTKCQVSINLHKNEEFWLPYVYKKL